MGLAGIVTPSRQQEGAKMAYIDRGDSEIREVELVDVDAIHDDTPSIREWAGFDNGHRIMAEFYDDGTVWGFVGKNDKGLNKDDFFQLYHCEFKEVE